eukprot:CAMPEP_0174704892 /NCGR_PEP_ID=MMETSP1094-20130205/8309_1 /TAXON_ID=156173 /ORGANISM="Chrysochromulina brevifilum, Strain UTEX LB 985" /LENGTH=594 /DNA_ID=CAMNT_0015902991 /DNA_START=20 /DNA_END=1805 /DNA_ORIENTATION=-
MPSSGQKMMRPRFVVLEKEGEEVKRWPVPVEVSSPPTNTQSESLPVALGHRTLRPASIDILLPPAVRKARDTAYAVAIESGLPVWIASEAAKLAANERAEGKPTALCLIMARTLTDILADDYSLPLAIAGAGRAGELASAGYSPGAAVVGGKANTALLAQGMSHDAAQVGAIAASEAAELAGNLDPTIAHAIARGQIPPQVAATSVAASQSAAEVFTATGSAQAAVAAGTAAGQAIIDGHGAEAARVAGSAAASAIQRGADEACAAAAGEAAANAITQGHSERAAAAAGAAAAQAILDGYEWNAATSAGTAAANAITDGYDEEAAAVAGASAAASISAGLDEEAAAAAGRAAAQAVAQGRSRAAAMAAGNNAANVLAGNDPPPSPPGGGGQGAGWVIGPEAHSLKLVADGMVPLKSWALDVSPAVEADVDTSMYLDYAFKEAGLGYLHEGKAPPMRPEPVKSEGTIHDDADGTEILSINDAANVVVDEVWARPKPNQPAAQEQEQCTVMEARRDLSPPSSIIRGLSEPRQWAVEHGGTRWMRSGPCREASVVLRARRGKLERRGERPALAGGKGRGCRRSRGRCAARMMAGRRM